MEAKILVVDDEAQIRKLLRVAISAYGYAVEEAASGKEALIRASMIKPDLLIVDLGLPDMDGKQVVKEVREWSSSPIIVLTARDQEQEKIAALDLGADDYVTKPFGTGELLARMRVCLRRTNDDNADMPVIQCGALAVDVIQRRVLVEGNPVKLTPTEYDLVKLLAKNAGRVVTHKQILKEVWDSPYGDDTHYIRVYIGQIRRKIEKDPTRPQYIVTESGIGYRMMG